MRQKRKERKKRAWLHVVDSKIENLNEKKKVRSGWGFFMNGPPPNSLRIPKKNSPHMLHTLEEQSWLRMPEGFPVAPLFSDKFESPKRPISRSIYLSRPLKRIEKKRRRSLANVRKSLMEQDDNGKICIEVIPNKATYTTPPLLPPSIHVRKPVLHDRKPTLHLRHPQLRLLRVTRRRQLHPGLGQR